MSILIDLTINSNRTDQVTPNKTIKEECVADEAIFNSHNLRSTTTGKFYKNTDLKREVIENNMTTDKVVYNTISTIHDGYYPQQIALQFETPKLRPALYSLKKQAVIINPCRIVRKFFGRRVNKMCLVTETPTPLRTS